MRQEPVRKLAAIMFTDMVGYTALMQTDESQAKRLRDRHRQVLKDVIPGHNGEIIQYYGDGTLSIFDSAKEAVEGASEIQKLLQTEPQVPLRIGIHTGDIVHDDEGVFGDGVNIASRIESLGIPGAVLLSESVQNELKNHPGLQTKSLGRFSLKNVDTPVEVYALASDGIVVPETGQLRSTSASRHSKGIAVLPLRNLSGQADNVYFGDGISEEIINGLSKVDGLAITSRSSAFSFRDTGQPPEEIGRRLKVSHVLEGSVRKAGNMVRVSVQLTNTADGYQLWSEIYERELENIFDVQEDIAQHVVNKLKENFSSDRHNQRIIDKPTDNPEAYNLYLKGMHYLSKHNPEQAQKARDALEEVIRMDPEFANAYTSMAQCYAFLGSCGVAPPLEAYSKAHEYALAALEKNADLAESHLALAMIKFFHFWDWKGTRESLEKADALGLNSAMMHQVYALFLAMIGKTGEAIRRMEKAVRQDPLSLPLICGLGEMYLLDGQYEQALEQFENALELDPLFRGAVESKAMALLGLSKLDESLESFITYQKMTKHPLKGQTGLCMAYAEKGDMKKARECLEKLRLRQEEDPQASLEMDFAIMHFGLDEYDKTVEYLNQVYEKRFSVMCTGMVFVMRCPYFEPLWETPGFKKLVERMELDKVSG